MRKRAGAWLWAIALVLAGVLSVSAAQGQGPAVSAVSAMTQQSLAQQSAQCTGVNGTDMPIPDGSTGTVSSAITISGCTGKP